MSGSSRRAAAAIGALMLWGCAAHTRPDAASGNRWSRDELAAAGLAAIERKQEKLRAGGTKSFDEPQEALDFFMAQRLEPGMPYPMQDLRAQLNGILAREQGGIAGGDDAWTWLGPGNVGGRTRALTIDPADPDVMYAGGVAGGIWKTTDGGASWNVADDLMLNLAIADIAIDPGNANVLYAGTGEGILLGDPGLRGLGIFKSVDAGATWSQLPGTVQGVPPGAFHYVNKVRVSANDSSRIYAATRTGVWRSLDAGQTWSIVLSNPFYINQPPTTNGCDVGCTDLQIRPDSDPDQLWAAFGTFQSDGVYRSDDGGDTWVPYTTGGSQGRMTIAFAPSDNDVMYILMANNGSTAPTGRLVNVFRSDDGGDSFAGVVAFDTLTGPWLLSNLVLATGCLEGDTYSQGWYDNIIKVDPVDPDIVWVGGVDLFRSTDGGANWEIPAYWFFYSLFEPPPYQVHPDHHNIVFHPDYDGAANQTMYVTNDGGIFRTLNARAATSIEDCPLPGDDPLPEIVWERLNNNYGVTQFYHGDSAQTADVFIGGCQDNGTNRAQSADAPNDWDLIFGGDGGYTAIDPTDADIMYVEYQFFPTIMKSYNGGQSFFEATNGITDTDGLFITPFAMDQSDPQTLWTGGSRPWRTTDGALNWEPVGPNFAGPAAISAIGIAPSDHNVVYLGFNNGYVARTTSGLSANPGWEVFTSGLIGGWVSSVTVDPADVDTAYVTYSNFNIDHVLRTVNGGQSWASIDGIEFEGIPDIPAHWIAVRPCNSQELYVATELGIFRSQDGGLAWAPFNDGLAHTVVESLDWQHDDRLVAFTHGRGAYRITLPSCFPCPADVDKDGQVGVTDLLSLLAFWGLDPGGPPDFDGNGTVDTVDLLALLAAWGPCP